MNNQIWIQDRNGLLYNISLASMIACLENANKIQVSYGNLNVTIYLNSKEETTKAWDFILNSLPNRFIISTTSSNK